MEFKKRYLDVTHLVVKGLKAGMSSVIVDLRLETKNFLPMDLLKIFFFRSHKCEYNSYLRGTRKAHI